MKVQELAEALAAFPHECRGTSRDRNADDCPVCLAAEYLGSPGGARDEDDAPELTADDFKRPSAKWNAPEPAGGHGNPCPLCKAHNLASCECPQEDHVDSVKVQPAFYRIQHKFDKGRFNDFSTDMWDLIIPGLPLTKEAKP